MVIKVIVYVDLTIICHIIFFIVSFSISNIINNKNNASYKYKLNNFFISLLAFIFNIYFIPFFYLFYLCIKTIIIYIFKKKYLLIDMITTFFYYLNNAFLLLVGGCFIYDGILYINRPISLVFTLFLPFLCFLSSICFKVFNFNLKANNYIVKAKLIIEDMHYKINGFVDTGNIVKFNNLPVIFINFDIQNIIFNQKINIKTLNKCDKQDGIKAKIIIKKKEYECYLVINKDLKLKANCNCLLNYYLFN